MLFWQNFLFFVNVSCTFCVLTIDYVCVLVNKSKAVQFTSLQLFQHMQAIPNRLVVAFLHKSFYIFLWKHFMGLDHCVVRSCCTLSPKPIMTVWPSLIKVLWPDSLYTKDIQMKGFGFKVQMNSVIVVSLELCVLAFLVFSCQNENMHTIRIVLMSKRSVLLWDWPLCGAAINVYKSIIFFQLIWPTC